MRHADGLVLQGCSCADLAVDTVAEVLAGDKLRGPAEAEGVTRAAQVEAGGRELVAQAVVVAVGVCRARVEGQADAEGEGEVAGERPRGRGGREAGIGARGGWEGARGGQEKKNGEEEHEDVVVRVREVRMAAWRGAAGGGGEGGGECWTATFKGNGEGRGGEWRVR